MSEHRTSEETICRFLRGKNGYGTLEGGGLPFFMQDTVNTQYRCLCTGEPFGPDSELADTSACNNARSCYEKPRAERESNVDD